MSTAGQFSIPPKPSPERPLPGRFVKRSGRLTVVDAAEIVARAKRSAEKIRLASGGVLTPVMPGHGNPIYCAAC